jgi:hypothetical protein
MTGGALEMLNVLLLITVFSSGAILGLLVGVAWGFAEMNEDENDGSNKY